MKKSLAILMALVLALGLSACGKSENESDNVAEQVMQADGSESAYTSDTDENPETSEVGETAAPASGNDGDRETTVKAPSTEKRPQSESSRAPATEAPNGNGSESAKTPERKTPANNDPPQTADSNPPTEDTATKSEDTASEPIPQTPTFGGAATIYKKNADDCSLWVIDLGLTFYPDGYPYEYDGTSDTSGRPVLTTLGLEGDYASRNTSARNGTKSYIMALVEGGFYNIPCDATWEELFDNDAYFDQFPHEIYEGERYIGISDRSGSGGPMFYYEIDADNRIHVLEPHPAWQINGGWGNYEVTDLVLSQDKTSVSGTVRFPDGVSVPAIFNSD